MHLSYFIISGALQANEDKKMRSYAVIPPLILDAKQKRCVFYNENGLVTDMENDFKVCLNLYNSIFMDFEYSVEHWWFTFVRSTFRVSFSFFLFWCFIFINSRTGKIQTYGQPAKRKFSKRNFYSIRRILAPLLLVWIERVHRIVCDTTTSAKKPKIINNCCENLVNEREAPEIQTNPIILNLSALSMQWQLEWQRGKTLDTLQKNEKLNLAAELNFD